MAEVTHGLMAVGNPAPVGKLRDLQGVGKRADKREELSAQKSVHQEGIYCGLYGLQYTE